MFLNTAEELSPDEVDDIVEMEIAEDPVVDDDAGFDAENELGVTREEEGGGPESGMIRQVRTAVDGLCEILGMDVPSDARIREAVEHVRRYEEELELRALNRPSNKKSDHKTAKSKMSEALGSTAAKKKLKNDALRYYGILPEVDLVKLVESTLESMEGSEKTDVRESLESMWSLLKSGNRQTKRPHVTLVHKNQLKDASIEGGANAKELWEACAEVYEMEGSPIFEGRFGSLVWNERVLAATFEDLNLPAPPSLGDGLEEIEQGLENLELNPVGGVPSRPSKRAFKAANTVLEHINADEALKQRLHVTIGTRDGKVAPVEGKVLVEEWRSRGAKAGADGEGEDKIWAVSLVGGGPVKGLIRGLIS